MTKYTAGPWIAEDTTVLARGGIQIHIAYCHDRHSAPLTDHAVEHARLLAAAPELLEALKLLLIETELSGNADAKDYGWPVAVSAARAAIAKATGA